MKRYVLILFVVGLVIITGCSEEKSADKSNSNKEKNKTEQNESKDETTDENSKEEKDSKEENATNKNKPKADATGYTLSSNDPLHVEIVGEAVAYDNMISIAGKTNLPEGARFHISPKTIGDSAFMGVSGYATVEADGTFNFNTDIPEEYKGDLQFRITFTPDHSNDEVVKLYGELGKKLKGPFIQNYMDMDRIAKRATVMMYLKRNEDGSESDAEIPTPTWNNPDDYGSTTIRMDTELKYDDKYIYIEGKSNLIQGSQVKVSIQRENGFRSGMGESIAVKPDGSFSAIFKNKADGKSLKNYKLRLAFNPSRIDWPTIKDKYGPNGEKMKGKLIETQSDGNKKAVKITQIKH